MLQVAKERTLSAQQYADFFIQAPTRYLSNTKRSKIFGPSNVNSIVPGYQTTGRSRQSRAFSSSVRPYHQRRHVISPRIRRKQPPFLIVSQ